MSNDPVEIAMTALQTAQRAELKGENHEKLCAERYANIDYRLSKIDESFKSLFAAVETLKSTAYKASGVDVVVRYIFLFIGAFGVVWGILT